MPEGPEVKKYADELASLLKGQVILSIDARTKKAKTWLERNSGELNGRRIKTVESYGKNIIGIIDGGFYFYSHQMMWGRWLINRQESPPARDPKERARIEVKNGTALLMSAPIFQLGKGDPYTEVPYLAELGPDVLDSRFRRKEFLERLMRKENLKRTIGDALLDQKICAGLGNYLRAEILFMCRLNPWKQVESLSQAELDRLCKQIPSISKLSYEQSRTVSTKLQERMRNDYSLVYVPGKEYGTRHYVFRRTNLPCLICANPIKQLRQQTTNFPLHESDSEERSRIIYFCPNCQSVSPGILRAQKSKPGKVSKGIKVTIIEMLAARSRSKSICPSEVARAIEPNNWRSLMGDVRAAADELVKENRIIILQKHRAVSSALNAKGPIRLALRH